MSYSVYRSAITGLYVSEEFAKENPDTTIEELLPGIREIVFVKGEWDWQAIYVDGVLYNQAHSFDFEDALELCAEGPFKYRVVWVDQDWADEKGVLPELLDEVKLQR